MILSPEEFRGRQNSAYSPSKIISPLGVVACITQQGQPRDGHARVRPAAAKLSAEPLVAGEDDARLADLTAEYLRKNDFEVAIEARGDTAEARILKDDPDLVILDVMLPGKDGFEVCRAVRGSYKGVILMFTARDEDLDGIVRGNPDRPGSQFSRT